LVNFSCITEIFQLRYLPIDALPEALASVGESLKFHPTWNVSLIHSARYVPTFLTRPGRDDSTAPNLDPTRCQLRRATAWGRISLSGFPPSHRPSRSRFRFRAASFVGAQMGPLR